MNLLLLDPSEVATDGSVSLTQAHAEHVRKVLKLGTGQTVRVGMVDGAMGVGTITTIADRHVELACAFDPAPPARPRVDLLLALPRPKVMRRLWAPLATLGVGQVILTNAEKVERDYFDSHVLQPEGYRPLLIEGLQQARDTHMPIVSIHKRLKVLVEDHLDALCPSVRRLVAHPGSDTRVATALADVTPSDRVLLATGPEGGWNDFELSLLETHGFARVGIGPRILTTTTACVALLTLVHEALRRG